MPLIKNCNYKVVFPAALAFFHRSFAAAEIFALAAADMVRLGFLTFAQRLFCANAIARLPAADMPFRGRPILPLVDTPPRMRLSSSLRVSIFSPSVTARLRSVSDMLDDMGTNVGRIANGSQA